MRVSISHSEIIVRKGWLGRATRYKVDAWLEWTEEEKNIVRQFYLGKHEAYTAEKWAEFPKFTYSINDLIYTRPHVRIFPTALAADVRAAIRRRDFTAREIIYSRQRPPPRTDEL
jgi:hypothetical protein